MNRTTFTTTTKPVGGSAASRPSAAFRWPRSSVRRSTRKWIGSRPSHAASASGPPGCRTRPARAATSDPSSRLDRRRFSLLRPRHRDSIELLPACPARATRQPALAVRDICDLGLRQPQPWSPRLRRRHLLGRFLAANATGRRSLGHSLRRAHGSGSPRSDSGVSATVVAFDATEDRILARDAIACRPRFAAARDSRPGPVSDSIRKTPGGLGPWRSMSL